LVLAAGTEFLLVAVAAYSAALLYHRLILLDSPDVAKYIQESLLISMLQLLASIGLQQYSRIQTQPRHVFLWSGASSVFFVFSFFVSTIFLLKILDGYSRDRHRPGCGRPLYGTLHTGNMVPGRRWWPPSSGGRHENLPIVSVDVGEVAERIKLKSSRDVRSYLQPTFIAEGVGKVLVRGKRLSGGCAGVDELSLAKRLQSVYERVPS
jgi:hypothetical protein